MPNGRLSRKYLKLATEYASKNSAEDIQITMLASLFWLEDSLQEHTNKSVFNDHVKTSILSSVATLLATAGAWFLLTIFGVR